MCFFLSHFVCVSDEGWFSSRVPHCWPEQQCWAVWIGREGCRHRVTVSWWLGFLTVRHVLQWHQLTLNPTPTSALTLNLTLSKTKDRIITLGLTGAVVAQQIRPQTLNCELSSSNMLAAAVVPLGKALYPHCLVPWRGLKAIGPLVACL